MSYTESQPQLKCLYGRKSEVENWKDKVEAEAESGWYTDVVPEYDITDIFKENWHFCVCFCVSVWVFYIPKPSHPHSMWMREEHFQVKEAAGKIKPLPYHWTCL